MNLLPPTTPKEVNILGDTEKMLQVLSNIISNAIKFSKGGNIFIEIKDGNGELICEVSDEGCGIEYNNLNRIFDRFYQVNQTVKGSGIGLTIAKAWIEAHGGKIWAESGGIGKGTKITFSINKK